MDQGHVRLLNWLDKPPNTTFRNKENFEKMKPSHLKILILLLGVSISSTIEIKGINFVSVPYTQAKYNHMNAKKSLAHLKDTGANWISIPIAYFQKERNSSEMSNLEAPMATRDRINSTPTKKEINDVVTMAKN